jgi:hypothetical protein
MSDRKHRPSDPKAWAELDRVALRYLDALDAGDLETAALLWEAAADDPDLERLLGEVTDGVAEEEGVSGLAEAAEQVRALLRATMPSAYPAEAPPPLSVGDVAARLQADAAAGARLDAADRVTNSRLLGDQRQLPDHLGLPHFEEWRKSLGVSASPYYWRAFRDAAVSLAMGRCEQAVVLAAARPAGPPKGGRP